MDLRALLNTCSWYDKWQFSADSLNPCSVVEWFERRAV